MRALAPALLAVALAVPTLAQADPNTPAVAGPNPNMRTVPYHPHARVQIIGNPGRPTVITFRPGEEVIRVMIGDGGDGAEQSWEGPSPQEVQESPLENIVYLYPRRAGYTAIAIITRSPRGQRAYQFGALVRGIPPCGRPACDDPEATYGLAFTYPDDERAEREAAARAEAEARRVRWEAEAPMRQARAEALQTAGMRARLDTDTLAGGACRNWRYEAEANATGRERILPDEVSDNGQETVFVFRGNRELPAFYRLAADGTTEVPVFPVLRGPETVALQAVAPQFRLRLGEAVVHVYNRHLLPSDCVSRTGTTSPDVARVLRRPAMMGRVATQ
ncbi:TrbG/VirB9 family P-type conjugative transfer protein [Paracraurococcus lichenis]|uniref:TrbG/VirB9 family P-type conjugative transfer protein n=1 Tax=Paracraurococcus lichenis TaxID=3064888 RepID=A0ABT9E6Q7_9PROT|nr:TrbG/VirB9 family P-type conjugative transfer protein [Paracraurococcus sp. LOR1-02]MDO9711777.1 TrbG/VirB9 family P-type conjugative transfer protein [Paracraurococcus sp. LOR1-02]